MSGENQNGSTPTTANPVAGNDTTVQTSGGTPTSTPVVAPKGFRQVLQQMLQGWQTVVPSGSTLQSSSGDLTQAAVLEKLQGYLEGYTTLDTQVTTLKQVRAQVESQLPEARQYIDVLRLAVANFFGAGSPQLVQFGQAPKKAHKGLSSETLAVRAAKARTTRVLRGTSSKKKKASIKAGPIAVQYVGAAQQTAPASAPDATAAASTALAGSTANAVSSPGK